MKNKVSIILLTVLVSLSLYSADINNHIVALSRNGSETLSMRNSMISAAENLLLWSFNFAGGQIFRDTLIKISFQMAEHKELKTFLLLSKGFLESEDEELLAAFKEIFAGRFFYIVTSVHSRGLISPATMELHSKLQIISNDNISVMAVGGSGLTKSMTKTGLKEPEKSTNWLPTKNSFVSESFRDTDAFVQGPAVQEGIDYFFKLFMKWHKVEGHPDCNFPSFKIRTSSQNFFEDKNLRYQEHVQLKFTHNDPDQLFSINHNEIPERMLSWLLGAHSSIVFAQMFFFPPEYYAEQFFDVMRSSSAKKILITNNNIGNGPFAALCFGQLNKANYPQFDEVYEYLITGVLYHKKILVIDDSKVFIGSFNMSANSFSYHDECGIFIEDSAIARMALDDLDDDRLFSTLIVNKADKEQNFAEKALGVLQETFLKHRFF
jgi:hypothetical protein